MTTEHDFACAIALKLYNEHRGEKKAAKNLDLKKWIHVFGGYDAKGSKIRSFINYARSQNLPICSSDKGYWWAENDADLAACIDRLEARIKEQQKTVKSLKLCQTM